MMKERTEHEKLDLVKDKSQAVGEFVDWLHDEKGFMICESCRHGYYPARYSLNKLLAEFFEIDLVKLEEEKEQMLEAMRRG